MDARAGSRHSEPTRDETAHMACQPGGLVYQLAGPTIAHHADARHEPPEGHAVHIVRGPRKAAHFTILSNRLLRDDSLSFRATGLLVFLLSYPDGTTIDSNDLGKLRKEGREAVRAAMREMREAGYLHLVKRQDERGRWVSQNVLFEEPTTAEDAGAEPPTPRNPSPVARAQKPANPQVTPRTGNPYVGGLGAKREGLEEGLGRGETPAPTPPQPVDKHTAPPPCRRHPNGWKHQEPCRACALLRQWNENLTAPAPLPMPPHCGQCDVTDRMLSTTDTFGRIVVTRCPRCHPLALTRA